MSESPQENTKPEAEPAPEPGREAVAEATPESGPEAAAEPSPGPAAEPPAAPARASRWRRAALSLIVIVAVAGLIAWQWRQNRIETGAVRQELAQKLADADAKTRADRRLAQEARDAVSAIQEKIGGLESRLGQTEAQQAALETLIRDLSRNRDDWALTEVEQALIAANQQLRLSGDVTAVLAALRTAQDKLQPLTQPELNGLRKAIGSDIARLEKQPTIDTAGVGAQLDKLLARVDDLPLAMDVRPQPGGAAAPGAAEDKLWKRLLRETWEELKQLVRVQRMDRPDIPLLAPSQAFFLRENLKLRLLGARLALLARDMRSYKADLGAARDWLRRYYDVGDDAVARAVNLLSNLYAVELSGEVPDISASLEAMRAYRRERAAQKP